MTVIACDQSSYWSGRAVIFSFALSFVSLIRRMVLRFVGSSFQRSGSLLDFTFQSKYRRLSMQRSIVT